jgi:hypothetical protein
MANKLPSGGGPYTSGQSSRIQQTKATANKYQKYFTPPVIPNLEKTQKEAQNAAKSGEMKEGVKSKFPQGIYHVGHFLPPDDRDNFYETLLQITGENKESPPFTKYGVVTAPESLVPYLNEKKEKAWYLNNLRTAEYLVDPTDPRTVKQLYEIYPELRDVPEQWYQDMMAVQWSLKELLQFGEIRSKDDHALVMHVCAPGFIIPRHPAWDPLGIIIENTDAYATKDQNYREKIASGFQKSHWNPFRYSTEGVEVSDPVKSEQEEWKAMILRRLYPGLRDTSFQDLKNVVVNQLTGFRDGQPVQYNITDNMSEVITGSGAPQRFYKQDGVQHPRRGGNSNGSVVDGISVL